MISYYGVFSIIRMYTHDHVIRWCFLINVYNMISNNGVFTITRMYTVWSVIMVFSASDVCIQHAQLLWCFSIRRMYTAWSVIMVFSVSDVCIQHGQLLWCFQHQTYVYSMISYYGVFSIRRMYDCVQQVQLLSLAMAKPLGEHRNARRPSVRACVRASVRPSVRPSVTKIISAITSDFIHRFAQNLTQWCIPS